MWPVNTLRWAVRIMIAQATVLGLVTALLIYYDITTAEASMRRAIGVTAYTAMMTVLMVVVARSLGKRRRWARAPAIVFQLLQVLVGYGLTTDGEYLVGVPVLLLALTGAVLLFAPSTRLALQEQRS